MDFDLFCGQGHYCIASMSIPVMQCNVSEETDYQKAKKAWDAVIDPILAVTRPEADHVKKAIEKRNKNAT